MRMNKNNSLLYSDVVTHDSNNIPSLFSSAFAVDALLKMLNSEFQFSKSVEFKIEIICFRMNVVHAFSKKT